MRQLRVLVSAYACEPDKGSEPGVGWNWAKQIANFAEVWVLTRSNNRQAIEQEMASNPESNLNFIYYDVPLWLGFWKKGTKGLYLYYLLWQLGAYHVAKKMHLKYSFDLAHHITFGNLWLPTFLPFLSVPFIWGPIGGGEQVPKVFRYEYPFKARLNEFIRDAVVNALIINPLFLASCKRAASIIVRTKESLSKIPERYQYKTAKILETGVDSSKIMNATPLRSKNDNQIVCVGRLIHLKGLDLALKAFAKVLRKGNQSKLLIIGDGPEKKRLMKICQEENIIGSVTFVGQVSHAEVVRYLLDSSLFLLPSLKEGGSWALFEAMLLGLPVICMDIAGPSEIVSEDCGIKIKPWNPVQAVDDIAEAIVKILSNHERMKSMGENGKQRVIQVFSWDGKREFIRSLYEQVLEKPYENSSRS